MDPFAVGLGLPHCLRITLSRSLVQQSPGFQLDQGVQDSKLLVLTGRIEYWGFRKTDSSIHITDFLLCTCASIIAIKASARVRKPLMKLFIPEISGENKNPYENFSLIQVGIALIRSININIYQVNNNKYTNKSILSLKEKKNCSGAKTF